MTAQIAAVLADDPDLSERAEAFVSRFARLQDTLGDKLLPALLRAMGERTSAAIDNLDHAERLGLLDSADRWTTVRELRNRMIHEYMEDPVLLADALQPGMSSCRCSSRPPGACWRRCGGGAGFDLIRLRGLRVLFEIGFTCKSVCAKALPDAPRHTETTLVT